MRGKGITYDTGFINKGVSSREPFDIAVVTRELQVVLYSAAPTFLISMALIIWGLRIVDAQSLNG